MSYNNLTDNMIRELERADVEIDLETPRTTAEFTNYIIHLYDVFILSPHWQFVEETAEICYSQRKYRQQVWTKPYNSHA